MLRSDWKNLRVKKFLWILIIFGSDLRGQVPIYWHRKNWYLGIDAPPRKMDPKFIILLIMKKNFYALKQCMRVMYIIFFMSKFTRQACKFFACWKIIGYASRKLVHDKKEFMAKNFYAVEYYAAHEKFTRSKNFYD